MKLTGRRQFLKQSFACTAGLTMMPFSRVRGANDDIRVAMVGLGSHVKIGGKGRQDLKTFRNIPGVRVVALCDVDTAILGPEVDKFKKRNEKVKVYTDVRKLLDDKDIDVVVNSTPNHWHALISIWACQAGKDVFVQKPASHNIFEGRKMVAAARKYNRIVQSGSGPRSRSGITEAMGYAKEGNLGRILYARGLNYKPRISIGKVSGRQAIPSTLDYDLWAGPAPKVPLLREYLHYDWHWDWLTGDGDLGNMGIHYMDACRLGLGENTLPRRVMSIGGRFGYDDDGETPNTQIIFLDYEPAPIIFEVRGLPADKKYLGSNWAKNSKESMDSYKGVQIGAILHCEGGYIANNTAYDKEGKVIRKFEATNKELRANFIDAVRSRKVTDLNSDILEGHISASLVHMANISHRLGKESLPGRIKEITQSNKEFAETFDRFCEHLTANGVDITKTQALSGPMLTINPETERFIGPLSDEANLLVTGNYREPYVVRQNL